MLAKIKLTYIILYLYENEYCSNISRDNIYTLPTNTVAFNVIAKNCQLLMPFEY